MSTRSALPLSRGSSGVTTFPWRSGNANRNGWSVSAPVSAVGATRCGAPVLRVAVQGVWVRSPAWNTPRRVSPSSRPSSRKTNVPSNRATWKLSPRAPPQKRPESPLLARDRPSRGEAGPAGAAPEEAVIAAVGQVRPLEALAPVPELEDPRAPPPVGDEAGVPAAEQRCRGGTPRPGAAARAERNRAGAPVADVPVHPHQRIASAG